MATWDTGTFLMDIDQDLVQCTDILVAKGYTNMRSLVHLTFQDIAEIPIGHHQLLINEVAKIGSQHSKALLTSLDTQEMQTSDGTLQPKELFPLAPNSSTSACGPIDHRIEEYNLLHTS